MRAIDILRRGPVLPVIVVDDAGCAVDLASALLEGGISVLEITLRTPAAMSAIRRIAAELPLALPGAGTVLDAEQWAAAVDAGARFGVSPGLTPALAKAARASGVPFIPGVATASEAMAALEQGYTAQKLFPAEAVGGRALLKSLFGPLPQITFCPTGGISPSNAGDYLACPNVACVGGSWLVPADAVTARDWKRIAALAAAAAALRGG